MKNINKTTVIIAIATLIIGVALGAGLFRTSAKEEHNHNTSVTTEENIWTCSMHPQIRQSEKGDCPLCGMDLIPVATMDLEEDNPMEIKMSPTAMQLANVQTDIVKLENPIKEVKLNGKVQVNERTVTSQTSHISGRIEKLLINTTGEYVSKGQIIAFVYSPELITAQEELFEAKKISSSNPKIFEAVKNKLKNWKLSNRQIDAILASGKPSENFPIRADMNGVVTTKRVQVGDYIKTGASLFEIADLSKVWLLFDVYESDMEWVRIGDEIEFTVQSFPNSKFKGKVRFIDPVINPKTRVAKARVVIDNKIGLKPEMFVSGTLNSVIKNDEKSIIVPKSAVMWTGEKSVVYIKTSEIRGVNFIMREVTLGTSLGSNYVINEGLQEGDEIATNGTFSIDASAQLAGKPSMMNPEGGAVMTGHNHGGETKTSTNKKEHTSHSKKVSVSKEVKNVIRPLFNSYSQIKDALVKDDFEDANKVAKEYQSTLSRINMSIFKGESHNVWMKHSTKIKSAINEMVKAKDIVSTRKYFVALSEGMVVIAKTFEPSTNTLYVQHCPMADEDNGADWISNSKEIQNPYFGEAMLKCGEVKTVIK